jgi:hypothetical protein
MEKLYSDAVAGSVEAIDFIAEEARGGNKEAAEALEKLKKKGVIPHLE